MNDDFFDFLGSSDPRAVAPPSEPRSAKVWNVLKITCGFIAALWLFFVVAHFWRSNAGLWRQGAEAPLGVFSYLGGSYTFSWDNCPPNEILAGLIALAIYGIIGWLALRGWDVYFSRIEDACLSVLLGAGICGAVFELLEMAHQLRRWPILISLAILAFLLVLRLLWKKKRPLESWSGDAVKGLEALVAGRDQAIALETPEARFEKVDGFRQGRIAPAEAAPWFTSAPPSRLALREVFRRAFGATLHPSPMRPEGDYLALAVYAAAALLVFLLMALAFFHALFYPETYWDSLILYLGYGRMTWLEGGFPFKASAQVGIGLGANYPHLFLTHAAAVSAVAGEWSDVPARLWAPAASLGATLLIYGAVRRIWRNPLAAILCALVFRALPYTIAYSSYASDYALALYFGAAFLFLAICYLESPLPGLLSLLMILPALAMRLNYLMGILWVALGAVILASHWRRTPSLMDDVLAGRRLFTGSEDMGFGGDNLDSGRGGGDSLHSAAFAIPGIFPLLIMRRFWAALLFAILLASPWYLRNQWLTGNPVYAFFPKIFGGIRINQEVLKSAEREWFLNGDGIGRAAEWLRDVRKRNGAPASGQGEAANGETAARANSLPPPRTLRERIDATWYYWIGFETFNVAREGRGLKVGKWLDRFKHLALDWQVPDEDRLLDASGENPHAEAGIMHWRHVYKMAPLACGAALPGFIACLAAWVLSGAWLFRRKKPADPAEPLPSMNLAARAGFIVGIYAILFFAYEYLIADFYLYQILPVVVALALLPGWILAPTWTMSELGQGRIASRILFYFLAVLILMAGVVPGLAMALMGFKFSGARPMGGELFSQGNLAVLHHPGMPAEDFLRLQYGEDVDMWNYLNRELQGERILTHENRHYCISPTIQLVHLDDWAIQRGYIMSTNRDKMALFRSLNIRHYLYVPNEDRHLVNSRLGISEWKNTALMSEIRRWGDNALYEFNWSAAGLPKDPPDKIAEIEDYSPAKSEAQSGGNTSETR